MQSVLYNVYAGVVMFKSKAVKWAYKIFIIEIIQALNMTFNFYICIIIENVKIFLFISGSNTHIYFMKMTAFAVGWVYVKVDLRMNMQLKYKSFLHWI